MRTPEDLAFILARVKAEMAANPPQGPLLAEAEPRAPRETCKRGHVVTERRANGMCPQCDVGRRLRAKGARW